MSDTRKDCCREETNLGETVQLQRDLGYRKCAVCGCRHFELTVDPGRLGMTGSEVGG